MRTNAAKDAEKEGVASGTRMRRQEKALEGKDGRCKKKRKRAHEVGAGGKAKENTGPRGIKQEKTQGESQNAGQRIAKGL